MFKGSIVALITPFKNNKLDDDSYIALIHHHLKNGTMGIVPAGTTGESPTLSHDEHKRVIELCVNETKGKIQHDLRKKRMVSEAAESTWKMVQDSNNTEDFRYFLEQFPDSPYSIPAKLKLKQLERDNQ